jgi:hypothetical protein
MGPLLVLLLTGLFSPRIISALRKSSWSRYLRLMGVEEVRTVIHLESCQTDM